MRHSHSATHPAALEMPEGFDPCGVPCSGARHTRTRAAASHRRHHRSLPGLAPTSMIVSVEGVATMGETDWFIWGCAGDRPVLFDVEASAAAEMMASVARGETATAIVEPWQLMLERLD